MGRTEVVVVVGRRTDGHPAAAAAAHVSILFVSLLPAAIMVARFKKTNTYKIELCC
jgi:hypothetical protein